MKMNTFTKSKHNHSNTHVHRKTYGTVFEKFEFNEPERDQIEYQISDVITNCGEKLFLIFEYRCL